MANQEQLAILKQGVRMWNEWREKNSDVAIDLNSADLSVAYLNGALCWLLRTSVSKVGTYAKKVERTKENIHMNM